MSDAEKAKYVCRVCEKEIYAFEDHTCEAHKPLIRAATGNHGGAKFDEGKIPAHSILRYFPRALEAVAKVSAHGAKIHGYDTWHSVPNALPRYQDARVRHDLAEARGEARDEDSGLPHSAHRAWNALAVLELELRKEGE